jgi:hypothetical protein
MTSSTQVLDKVATDGLNVYKAAITPVHESIKFKVKPIYP